MARVFYKLVSAAAMLMLASSAFALDFGAGQDEYYRLRPGEKIERSIAKGDKQFFLVALKRGELLHFGAVTKGADVTLAVAHAVERKALVSINANKTANGFEGLSFVPEADGDYLVGVFQFEEYVEGASFTLEHNAPHSTPEQLRIATRYLTDWGDAAYKKPDYEMARIYLDHALRINEIPDAKPETIKSIKFNLGNVYYALKNDTRALALYTHALVLARQLNEKVNEAALESNIGNTYNRLKNPAKALESLERSLQLYRGEKLEDDVKRIIRVLMTTAYDAGDYKKSVHYYEQALLTPNDKTDEASLLATLAERYVNILDYEKGKAAIRRAIDIRKGLNLKELEANSRSTLAGMHLDEKNWDESMAEYGRARDLYREIKEIGWQSMMVSNMGLAAYRKKDFKLSLALYNEALAIAATDKDRSPQSNSLRADATALSGLGTLYSHGLLDRDKAIEFFLKAAAASQVRGFKSDEANDIAAAADAHQRVFRWEKAVELGLKAVELYKQAGNVDADRGSLSFVLVTIGSSYAALDKLDLAEFHLDEARRLAIAAKDRKQEGIVIGSLQYLAMQRGQRDKALKLAEEGLKIALETKYPFMEIISRRDIGWIDYERGRYEPAIANFKLALALAEKEDARSELQNILNNLGIVYSSMGRQAESLAVYRRSFAIAREMRDRWGEFSVLNNLGVIDFEVGDFHNALEIFTQADKIAKELKLEREMAFMTANLGIVNSRLKRYDTAFPQIEAAMPILRARREFRFLSGTLHYYGKARRERGEIDQAIALHTEQLTISRDKDMPKVEMGALIELGLDQIEAKKIDSALDNFERALSISRSMKYPEEEPLALDGLAQVWSLRGFPKLSILFGKEAINLLQEQRGEVKKLATDSGKDSKKLMAGFLADKEPIYRRLAEALIIEGRLPEAQQVMSMLKEEEMSGFVRRDAKEIEALAKRADLRPNEKSAIERYNQFSSRVSTLGAELAALDLKKAQLKTGEVFAEQARYDELNALIKDANTAFRVFLDKELVAEFGKTKKTEIDTDRNLQGKLQQWGEGTVALSTIVGDERYRVILTTSKTQIDGKHEIKSGDLNMKVDAFRRVLLDDTADPRPLGKELYDILVKPIEKDLEAVGAKTLLWSLDGTLRYIPIAALWDGERYLIEKYQNVVLTSTTRQSLLLEPDKNWRVLGAGVSKASTVDDAANSRKVAFDELAFVSKELGSVSGGVSLLDATFTESNLKTELTQLVDGKRKHNVVHFATHFRLGSDTADSFLLLGNDKALTLAEVADSPEMNLTDVELVTLSACNTGFGGIQGKEMTAQNNGKEVDSLAQFIEMRGAKSVMATLWAVVDESTAMLMGEFYRLRRENPTWSKAETIRRAQLTVLRGEVKASSDTTKRRRSDPIDLDNSGPKAKPFVKDTKAPFAHPHYWAPFVLIGNWR